MENYKIPVRALHASTYQSGISECRLNRVDSGGFCTASTLVDEFLQIDVGRAAKVVSGVAVQGKVTSSNYYLVEFTISYSRDGINYVPYQVNGKDKVSKPMLIFILYN
jgi:hypothetical protein